MKIDKSILKTSAYYYLHHTNKLIRKEVYHVEPVWESVFFESLMIKKWWKIDADKWLSSAKKDLLKMLKEIKENNKWTLNWIDLSSILEKD